MRYVTIGVISLDFGHVEYVSGADSVFLVTGATGPLGRRITQRLRDQDDPVRAFVRLEARYGELLEQGADIWLGDLRQARDIERSLRGVRYVISAHGAGREVESLIYRANVELIDQAKAQGVEHFTLISVLGAERGYEDSPTFKAKRAVELYLQGSGLNYTILRPAGLAHSLLPLAVRLRETGFYLLLGDPETRTSIVSTDDLARIAADSARNPRAQGQVLAVGGPAILRRAEIPMILGRAVGRSPFVVNLPLPLLDGARSLLSLVNPTLDASLGTLRTLVANEFFCPAAQVAQVESLYGFSMEALESFLRRSLG